jgi:uncharacterized protein (DUF1330 family)
MAAYFVQTCYACEWYTVQNGVITFRTCSKIHQCYSSAENVAVLTECIQYTVATPAALNCLEIFPLSC